MMGDGLLQGRCILVVEDEYFMALTLKVVLTKAGAMVLGPAPSVHAALELIETGEAPDAAVLDVNLGGDLVFPVADRLQSLGIPFLFTTGFDRALLPERHAAVPWLLKPVESAVTLRELEHLLEKI